MTKAIIKIQIFYRAYKKLKFAYFIFNLF